MRKRPIAALLIGLSILLMGATARPWTDRQQAAHEAAEILRAAGVEDDHATIEALQALWWSEHTEVPESTHSRVIEVQGPYGVQLYTTDEPAQNEAAENTTAPDPVEGEEGTPWEAAGITWEDYCTMCNTVYHEAGPGCSFEHMQAVAGVIWNRVKSDRFPGTVLEVICQPRQYSSRYVTDSLDGIAQEDIDAVDSVLRGEFPMPADVVWQAQFFQGSYIWNTYEVNSDGWHSITYICGG